MKTLIKMVDDFGFFLIASIATTMNALDRAIDRATWWPLVTRRKLRREVGRETREWMHIMDAERLSNRSRLAAQKRFYEDELRPMLERMYRLGFSLGSPERRPFQREIVVMVTIDERFVMEALDDSVFREKFAEFWGRTLSDQVVKGLADALAKPPETPAMAKPKGTLP